MCYYNIIEDKPCDSRVGLSFFTNTSYTGFSLWMWHIRLLSFGNVSGHIKHSGNNPPALAGKK